MRNIKLVVGILLLILLIAGSAQAAKDREQELQRELPVQFSEIGGSDIWILEYHIPVQLTISIDVIGHE